MKYILDSREAKAADAATIQYFGVPSPVLMERAALTVVEEIEKRYPGADSFLIVCGSGNNGGDGFAAARLLFLEGHRVVVAFVGNENKMSADGAMQLAIVRKYGIPVISEIPEENFDVVLDGVFGIGLSRDVAGHYAEVIRQMNEKTGIKVAIDISSGINADDGRVMGTAFRADLTVTFGFAKRGHLLYPGASYAGELVVTEIGIDEVSLRGLVPPVKMLEEKDLALLPARRADTNKGSYGKVLVIAGSVNMAGAAYFSASAAYRTGAGLVRVLTPEENRVIIQSTVPEAVLTTYNSGSFEKGKVLDCLAWADAIVLGPGLGTGEVSAKIVETVLSEADCPCVVDADALNLAAERHFRPGKTGPLRILTPHPGEMARLCGCSVKEVKDSLLETALSYAKEQGVILVLKDAHTVTALPDGTAYINASGNNGMATGGSGDVLAGVIAGLLAQGCTPETAAPLGVYVHGLAGDAAAERYGKYGMTASDLAAGIPEVLKKTE